MYDSIRMGASAAGAYEIDRSLRFNSGDNTRLTRTPSSSADDQKQTYSFWCKRTGIDEDKFIITAWNGSNTDRIGWQADNQFFIEFKDGGSTEAEWHSTRLIRDPSAWYHIVVAIDTTLATEADRMKAYINGERITDWATNDPVSQNYNLDAFGQSGKYHAIGAYTNSGSGTHKHFNGYIADFHFIDGAQKAPTDFGETDADTGQWIPIEYKGTYGSQGWYLNFSDNSNTTSGTLGADSSGNSNDWTPENFSVAAGAGNDSVTDTPTNNFCTFNPLYPTNDSYANGNLDVTTTNADSWAASTFKIPESGKWFYECTLTSANHPYGGTIGTDTYTGTRIAYYGANGQKVINSTWSSYGATLTTNDVVGCAINRDDGEVTFYKNGTSQGTITSCFTAGKEYYVIATDGASSAGDTYSFNFGQRAFAHTIPTGYKTLCTANLPEPTIKDGTKHFNTVLYTGNGSTSQAITGVGFQPDMVFNKSRSAAYRQNLMDSVRGAGKFLQTAVTDAEKDSGTSAGTSTHLSFDADGFTIGTPTSGTYNADAGFNENTTTYVAWNWKKSASAGIDIVSYSGNDSADQDRNHALGVAPDLFIVKSRTNAQGWYVFHYDSGADKYLNLDGGGLQATNTVLWANQLPTGDHFTIGEDGNGWATNEAGETYIAYLFSSVEGFSKVGTFTGNGNADGTFIHTGFKTAWVVVKRIVGGSGNWNIFDTKRPGDNVANDRLFTNITNAEINGSPTDNQVDLLSNGFKMRGNNVDTNGSGSTYIYLAFAEAPYKYANAR